MRAKFIYSFILIVLVSCKHQKTNAKLDSLDHITIAEYACEGECPEYSITIFNNGKADYSGKLNVLKIGDYQCQFPEKEIKSLFELIHTTDINEYKIQEENEIADLPETVITYRNNRIVIKKMKSLPKDIQELVVKMKKLARDTGYID